MGPRERAPRRRIALGFEHLRRDRRSHRPSRPGRSHKDFILANQLLFQIFRTSAIWRRGAGNCRLRPYSSIIDHLAAASSREAGLAITDLDGVAATAGPGPPGGLMVRAYHRQGDCAGDPHAPDRRQSPRGPCPDARPDRGVAPPYLVLLVSGGLRQLRLSRRSAVIRRYGTTSTTPWARPSTRRRSSSACPFRAARPWSSGRGGDPGASTCRPAQRRRRAAIFLFRVEDPIRHGHTSAALDRASPLAASFRPPSPTP